MLAGAGTSRDNKRKRKMLAGAGTSRDNKGKGKCWQVPAETTKEKGKCWQVPAETTKEKRKRKSHIREKRCTQMSLRRQIGVFSESAKFDEDHQP